jgi:hypothetical protein
MNKFLFSTKSLSEADGANEPFDLEYYILESQTKNGGINISTYGIEIVKTQRSKGIKYTEAKTIHEVCSGEKTIYKIAKLLSDYTVTPISLEEVLEDISRGSPNDELEISPSA